MIHFRAKVLFAACETDSPITRGSVGIPVEFEFSPEWDGLSKIAVYRGSGISVDQALTEGTGTVPSNVLTGVGGDLYIGVYGRNAAGTIVMPTIWAKVGRIQPGAKPSSVDPTEPEPDWTAQVQATAENALAVAQEALQKAEEGGTGLSDDVKQTLLQLAQKVAYVDDQGQTYYNDLYNALYPQADLVSISATFNQGNTVVYDTASLDSLKPMLTVTAHYDDGSTASVGGYTLSGSLTAGTSTITVAYQGKTATFTVTVTHKEAVLTGISAVFTQGSHTVYSGDSLDTLKPYLVVSASWDDGTSSTVDSYTLSGTLTTGTSTITVSYGGETDTFTVAVTERPATLTSITAGFNQGTATIYDTDSLDTLKQYLVVTATYSDSSTANVPSADYTLSGTLAEGTSTITVSYGGKTTTFNVTVSTYDTSPVIMTEGVCWSKTAPNTVSKEGFGITKWYDYEFTQEALEACQYWDAENGYMTMNGWTGIKYYISDVNTLAAGYSWPSSANYRNVIGKNGIYTASASITKNAEARMQFERYSVVNVEANGVSFTLPLLDLDDCYAYWYKQLAGSILPSGVSEGDIIFAGKNTPYYGLHNISEAT